MLVNNIIYTPQNKESFLEKFTSQIDTISKFQPTAERNVELLKNKQSNIFD